MSSAIKFLAASVFVPMSIAFMTIFGASDADAKVNSVKNAAVFDDNGKRMGIILDYTFPANDVVARIGLIIDGRDYIFLIRPVGFTSPGDIEALYETTNCSGQPYVDAEEAEQALAKSMLDTIPIIASNDPIGNPENETLWEVDEFASP